MSAEQFISPQGKVFTIGLVGVANRLGPFLDANNITTNALWLAQLQTQFDATNAAGMSPATRALFIEFFHNLVKFPT